PLRSRVKPGDAPVVGVVNAVGWSAPGGPPQPSIYFPLRQHVTGQVFLYVKARSSAAAVAADVVGAVKSVDAALRVERIRIGDQNLADALLARRVGTRLLVIFGSLALFLSTIG